jgi:hypothetical protein
MGDISSVVRIVWNNLDICTRLRGNHIKVIEVLVANLSSINCSRSKLMLPGGAVWRKTSVIQKICGWKCDIKIWFVEINCKLNKTGKVHITYHSRHMSRKKIFEHKMYGLVFSTILSGTFLILRRIKRDIVLYVLRSTYKASVVVVRY